MQVLGVQTINSKEHLMALTKAIHNSVVRYSKNGHKFIITESQNAFTLTLLTY